MSYNKPYYTDSMYTCLQCGTIFNRKKDKRTTPKFCSKKCACRNRNTTEHQKKAAKAAGAVIAKRTRGTGTKWYIKLNGVHEHRIVAAIKLGRPLKTGEIVHHKDNNKHNNDPSNLEVMTQAEHIRLHLHNA